MDDKDAVEAAAAYIKDPKNAETLKTAEAKGEPPPPPTQNGDRYFAVNVGGESTRQQYSWVEVGKEELYSLQLNSAAENTPDTRSRPRTTARKAIWAKAKRGQGQDERSPAPASRRPSTTTGPSPTSAASRRATARWARRSSSSS